jgi:hypothetical protein
MVWWGSLKREDRLEDIAVKVKFFFSVHAMKAYGKWRCSSIHS